MRTSDSDGGRRTADLSAWNPIGGVSPRYLFFPLSLGKGEGDRGGEGFRDSLWGGLLLAATLLLGLLLSACGPGGKATPTPTPLPTPAAERGAMKSWPNPPPMTIDAGKQYVATLKTNFGDIVIELLPKEAPLAVNNFVFLSRQGFYDGVKFHRVARGFVIQTGDPTGTGAGGPGYHFPDEKVTRDYVKGAVAMANSGPNTNGSQFFITLTDLSGRLPKSYTLFGLVKGGLDVVDRIGSVPVAAGPTGEASSPTVDVHIETVTISEK